MNPRIVWCALSGTLMAACVTDYELSPKLEEPIAEQIVLPEARCQVQPNPVAPPFEAATWVGENSEDPLGYEIVDYTWRLVDVPDGSSVTMPGGAGPNRAGFLPDLVGDYTAVLQVTNEYGDVSEPCTAVLNAIPAENLRVEMFWEIPDDDMDLHLIRGGANAMSGGDCYYLNCTPGTRRNWGDPSSTDDDPHLDLDDIPGTGPENINIVEPSEDTYIVAVHDYPYTGVMHDPNPVTVNVYMNGELIWTDTRAISGEDVVEEFAEIDWAGGKVNPL